MGAGTSPTRSQDVGQQVSIRIGSVGWSGTDTPCKSTNTSTATRHVHWPAGKLWCWVQARAGANGGSKWAWMSLGPDCDGEGSGMATAEKQVLRESRGRSCLLAFFARSPSEEELTWDKANLLHFTNKTSGMHRALITGTSTCAFLQREGDRNKRNSYLEIKHLVVQFSFHDERVTKLLSLDWECAS